MTIEAHISYGYGRQSFNLGWEASDCPYTNKEDRKNWFLGRRDAMREEQLDQDFEWDADEGE